jgi:hypothetical protein
MTTAPVEPVLTVHGPDITPAQVSSASAYQADSGLPPLRCPRDECPGRRWWRGSRYPLLCDSDGMFCAARRCGYRQDWVPEFMADRSCWQRLAHTARGRKTAGRLARAAGQHARAESGQGARMAVRAVQGALITLAAVIVVLGLVLLGAWLTRPSGH